MSVCPPYSAVCTPYACLPACLSAFLYVYPSIKNPSTGRSLSNTTHRSVLCFFTVHLAFYFPSHPDRSDSHTQVVGCDGWDSHRKPPSRPSPRRTRALCRKPRNHLQSSTCAWEWKHSGNSGKPRTVILVCWR